MVEINVINAIKEIRGNIILNNINLKIKEGKIVGIVGKNGSGKTMLLRMLAGLIKPTSGEVIVSTKNIGVVIENASMYPDFTGISNLLFLAKIRGVIGKSEIEETMKKVGLDPSDKKKVKNYSLGMRQRLALAQAFMEDPDVILLDEPTNALDKESVQRIYNIINQAKAKGKIILIVSHNIADIENLCDEVFVMEEGKLRRNDI